MVEWIEILSRSKPYFLNFGILCLCSLGNFKYERIAFIAFKQFSQNFSGSSPSSAVRMCKTRDLRFRQLPTRDVDDGVNDGVLLIIDFSG